MKPRQSNGVDLIATERQRQVDAEGWPPEHDDEHDGQIASAAVAYAIHAWANLDPVCGWTEDMVLDQSLEAWWPWDARDFKPTDDPTRTLVKAGALIAAEIDRLQRKG